MTVAALYVDPRGIYPKLLGAALCWDAERDARTYTGPWPIVAHPACGPWGRLRHMYQGGEGGPELGCIAVRQVRQWGGVLEHPADSRLWEACELPRPGDPPDAWGGWTIRVNQSDFGHVARKPTWLYLVRVERESLQSGGRSRASQRIGSEALEVATARLAAKFRKASSARAHSSANAHLHCSRSG